MGDPFCSVRGGIDVFEGVYRAERALSIQKSLLYVVPFSNFA